MRRRRRNYKRKSRAITRFVQPQSGFPDRVLTKLRYVQTVTLGNGSYTVASHTFRCNSLFDPDYSGTGHQPMYFDQYAALYQYYDVKKAKIHVDVANLIGGTTLNSVMVGLDLIGNTVSSILDPNQNRERPGATFRTVTTQFPKGTMTKWWTPRKFNPTLSFDNSALVSSDPATTAVQYFRVYAMSLDNVTPLQSNQVSLTVTIDYYAEFWGLNDIASS